MPSNQPPEPKEERMQQMYDDLFGADTPAIEPSRPEKASPLTDVAKEILEGVRADVAAWNS